MSEQDLERFALRLVKPARPAPAAPRQPHEGFFKLWRAVAEARGVAMASVPGNRGARMAPGAAIARVELCTRAEKELGMKARAIARELRISHATVNLALRGYVGGDLAKAKLAPPRKARKAS